jgi:four helix bundle protein
MSDISKLEAWKAAHQLVLQIYSITKKFPSEERFRLVNQICRSASSIAANLVEGNGRSYKKEYLQFVYLSRGSLDETKYHLLLAKDLEYITQKEYDDLIGRSDEVGKLINGLIKYLRSQLATKN